MTEDRSGGVLIAVAVGLLALTLGAGAILENRTISVPSSDRETIVLLDLTDPLMADQIRSLGDFFRTLEPSLRVGERVSLWVLARFPEGELRHLFSRTYPGRYANPLIANPRFASARCDSLFSIPLSRSLQGALVYSGASSTPALECIRDVSETDFHSGAMRRFILISDLAENSADLSLYQMVPTVASVRRAEWFRGSRANLRGTAVEVYEIARPRTSVSDRLMLRTFWRAYVEASGAASIEFRRL